MGSACLCCPGVRLSTSLVVLLSFLISLSLHSSQSRTRSLNPPSLTLAHFPSPPTSSPSALPALSHVLSLLLPLHVTLPLSLDLLNSVPFSPESVNEDLLSGYLQLAHGTTMLMTEGGIQEGKLVERGVLNVQAIQQVINTQTHAYKVPFREFSFPTDIGFVILAQGTKSALFQVRKQSFVRSVSESITDSASADRRSLTTRSTLS